MKRIFLSTCLLLISVGMMLGQQLAFPGAEGYGKYASGGRGGRVIEVTNLKDIDIYGKAIEGSLRAALATEGTDPITIIFKVSGVIEISSYRIKCGRPNITIAGQTAPGEGICIKNGGLHFSGENLIIRFIRFRPGDELKANPSGLNIENAKNIIIDHCSFSWAIEENATFYDNKNTTVQWCILSESLYDSYHSKGARGYAGQWGGQYSSYHHNLLAHNSSRSPRINGSRAHDTIAWVDFRNNVVYNWGRSGSIYGGEEEITGGECKTNFVNNYYKPGPATPSSKYFAAPSYVSEGDVAKGYAEWYFSGNYMEGVTGGMNDDNWLGVDASDVGGTENIRVDTVTEMSPVNTYTAQETYDSVLKYAGAILPVRDEVDERIIAETKGDIDVTGDGVTGENKGIIDSQTAVGGWPEYINYDPPSDYDHDGISDEWEMNTGLDPFDPSDGQTITEDGYSNLEHYLNSITGITGTPIVNINNHYSKDKFSIFPNPSNGIIHIKPGLSLKYIEIIDISGRKVFYKKMNMETNSVSLNQLKPGLYYIHAVFNNGKEDVCQISIK